MVLPGAYLTLTVSPVLAIEEDYTILWATTFNYNYYSDLWKVYNYHRDVTQHLRANMKLMRRRKRSLVQNTFNMITRVFAHPNTIISSTPQSVMTMYHVMVWPSALVFYLLLLLLLILDISAIIEILNDVQLSNFALPVYQTGLSVGFQRKHWSCDLVLSGHGS